MTIRLQRDGDVAWLHLDKPAKLNALTPDDFERLADLLEGAGAGDARAVVITGTGRAFCAGADLSDVRAEEHVLSVMRRIHRAARVLHHLPVPTVAAVNGAAAGAGANLAFGCDLVVAARSAKFVEIFIKRGLSPDFGGSWLLPRLVGMQTAKRLLLLGDSVPAETALTLGLVSEVVDDDELVPAAGALARLLADGPPIALAQTRQLLSRSLSSDFDSQLDAEAAAVGINAETEDSGEGIAAFLERRPPVFRGR